MLIALGVLGVCLLFVLISVASEIGGLTRELRATRDARMESSAAVATLMQAANDEQIRIRKVLEGLVENTRYLRSIAQSTHELVPQPTEDPGPPAKEHWKIDNEEREELRKVLHNLDPHQLSMFIGTRYHLPPGDSWVASIVKLRTRIGLDAAITALRRRDDS